MPFNIDNFRSKGLESAGARPTAFEVLMKFPDALADSDTISKHPYLISAATLPASDIGEIRVPYFGRDVTYPGDRTFGRWTVNVMNDEDFLLKKAFERWQAGINSIVPNVMIEEWKPADYKTNAEVRQYSKAGPAEGKIIRNYHFDGLWPMHVGDIRLGWGLKDTIESFEVTFAYDFWIPNDLQSLGGPEDFN